MSKASVLDSYGLGPAAIAVGNANTAGGPTAYAAHSNPANLALTDRSEIAFSSLIADFHLQDLSSEASRQLPMNTEKESQAPNLQGSAFGLNFKLRDELHFGFAAFLPQGSVARIKGLSPYDKSYLRYANHAQVPAVYSALAIKGPWGMAFGAGAYYSVKAKGVLQIALDSQESAGRIDFILDPVVVPYAGLSWKFGAWSLGALYRAAQKSESTVDSSFSFSTQSTMIPFSASTSLVPFYDPQLLRLGLAWQTERILFLLSLEEAGWSRYTAPIVKITGSDVAALSVENRPGSAGLRDTRAIRFGMEAPLIIYEQSFQLRMGFEINSSANHSSKSSFVIDPERRTLAIGFAYILDQKEQQAKLSLEGALQYSQLVALKTQTPLAQPIELHGKSSIQTWVGGLSYAL